MLRFTPFAWGKLLFLRDVGETEVGGFGISAEDDLLLVEDLRLVGQRTTIASVRFDDEAVADFVDQQVDSGLSLERFFRLWVHTHPGDSAEPSSVDEETFARVFGRCDWAVMAIVAQQGETYSRLRFNTGPGGEIEIPVLVDYARPFPAADPAAWEAEYDRCVRPDTTWLQTIVSHDDFPSWPESPGTDPFPLPVEQPDDDEFGPILATERSRAAGETE